MITVGNGYKDGWTSGHYIGRSNSYKAGSALANPFVLKDSKNDVERDRVVAQYRSWLWEKIQASDKGVMKELESLREQATCGDVHLLCYCSPKKCHGDVIKNCIEWMIANNK